RRDPAWTADGFVSDHWMPVSPVTGRLDAFQWKEPLADLGPHVALIEAARARFGLRAVAHEPTRKLDAAKAPERGVIAAPATVPRRDPRRAQTPSPWARHWREGARESDPGKPREKPGERAADPAAARPVPGMPVPDDPAPEPEPPLEPNVERAPGKPSHG